MPLQPTLGASWPQSMAATQPSLALHLAVSPGLARPPSPAPAAPLDLLWSRWLSLPPGPFLSPGLKHPWAPALSTALRAAAPVPEAAGPAGALLLPEPLQTTSPTGGPHLQVSSSIPVLSPPMCSLQAQSGFGAGLAAQFCSFFSSWRPSISITSLYCEYPWQCCDKRLAQEHLLWPWWWQFLPTHAHDTWPSCARKLCPCPLRWDKGTAGEMGHTQQPARHRVQVQ